MKNNWGEEVNQKSDITKVKEIFQSFWKYVLMAFIVLTVYSWVHSYISWKYEIWVQRQHGMAELARADGNRQIRLTEAKAEMESAKCHAEAEVIRAHGVAEANKIIGDSLKDNESYLRYRWIEGLQTNQMQVVYIPTEAGLPILETNRLREYQKYKE